MGLALCIRHGGALPRYVPLQTVPLHHRIADAPHALPFSRSLALAKAALASCGDDGVLRTWIWKPEKEDEESGVDRVRAVNAAAAERRGSR